MSVWIVQTFNRNSDPVGEPWFFVGDYDALRVRLKEARTADVKHFETWIVDPVTALKFMREIAPPRIEW